MILTLFCAAPALAGALTGVVVPTTHALTALEVLCRELDWDGGVASDPEWAADNLTDTSVALGALFADVARALPAGPAAAELARLGLDLAATTPGGSGDAAYWTARCREIVAHRQLVGTRVATLVRSLGQEVAARPLPASALVPGLARLLRMDAPTPQPDANAALGRLGNYSKVTVWVGRIVVELAGAFTGPARQPLAREGRTLAVMHTGGGGGGDYWNERLRAQHAAMVAGAKGLDALVGVAR